MIKSPSSDALCNGVCITPLRRVSEYGRLVVVFGLPNVNCVASVNGHLEVALGQLHAVNGIEDCLYRRMCHEDLEMSCNGEVVFYT
jgi:hypothetical protein